MPRECCNFPCGGLLFCSRDRGYCRWGGGQSEFACSTESAIAPLPPHMHLMHHHIPQPQRSSLALLPTPPSPLSHPTHPNHPNHTTLPLSSPWSILRVLVCSSLPPRGNTSSGNAGAFVVGAAGESRFNFATCHPPPPLTIDSPPPTTHHLTPAIRHHQPLTINHQPSTNSNRTAAPRSPVKVGLATRLMSNRASVGSPTPLRQWAM